jgi:diamine N-acetyltransferase
MEIELVPVEGDDVDRALALELREGQTRFVAPVAQSLDDARDHPEARPWMRLVLLDGEPAGFVMLSWDVVPDPPRLYGPWFLWRLLVDGRRQGSGVGRAIIDRLAAIVREQGGRELLTSCVPGPDGPEGFYLRLGFEPTGGVDPDGEILLRLRLA